LRTRFPVFGRTQHRQRLLDEGRVDCVDRIAELEGVDTSYVRRLLRLTLMPPASLEALVADPSAALKVLPGRPVPLGWRQQWQVGNDFPAQCN
jgi:hypothetical protein